MSGHDNFDFGQDALLSGTTFDPDAPIDWADEAFLYVNNDNFDLDGPMHGNMEIAENNSSIPLNAPVQQGPAFDGTTYNGAGYVNDNANQSQFSDLPRFASPPAQDFGAEPMSKTPLVHADHAHDQPIHTSAPAETFNSQPEFIPSPMNYGTNSYNFMGLNNNSAWSLNGLDQHNLLPAYPATTAPGQYPLPPQQQYPVLQRTLFHQGGQAMAGAGAIGPHNNFQVHTAGNPSFAPQPQGSSSNAYNGLPHPNAPQAPRNIATQPASDVGATAQMSQDSNDDAKPAPPPAEPVKETKTKQRPRKRSTKSTAKQPAVKVPVYSSELLVSNLDDAKTTAITRIKLKVVDDDRDDVAAHPEVWVPKISKALDAEFRTQAENHEKLTKELRDEFTRWQKEHENKTWVILSEQKDISKFAQSCAYILWNKALESHALGLENPGKAISNGGADVTSKCSERINAAITAIEEYSIVKYDFLRRDRLEALLASPAGFVSRKAENMAVNYKKKQKAGKRAALAAAKAKSQGKRKRKESSPPASDDEGEEEDEVEGEDDEEFVQPNKRTKRR